MASGSGCWSAFRNASTTSFLRGKSIKSTMNGIITICDCGGSDLIASLKLLSCWARKLLLLGSGTVLVLAAVLYAAVFGLTDTFVSWFNSENSVQMAQYAHTGMRMYFVGYFFAGFNIMAAGYLSAVNRPVEASITSICRGMVAIVACSLVLSAVFGMPGVWAAFPASELLTALLTLFLLRRKESGKA